MRDKMEDFVERFHREGLAVIPDFLSEQDIREITESCKTIMEAMNPTEHSKSVFRVGQDQGISRDEYFLTSGDKIRFFFEPDAVDKDGNLLVPKDISVNKIGHGLAILDPAFRKVSFSDKIKSVCRKLNLADPRLAQSMYIFKNPKGLGQQVNSHQDSTYLYVDPPSKLTGFWFALEDATLENGCLSYIPGSHVNGPSARFVRNSDPNGPLLTLKGKEPDNPLSDFVAAPVAKGSLVLIHGNVIHRSERNHSDKSRHAYTFHIVDLHEAKYSEENWLQETKEHPFPSVYSTEP